LPASPEPLKLRFWTLFSVAYVNQSEFRLDLIFLRFWVFLDGKTSNTTKKANSQALHSVLTADEFEELEFSPSENDSRLLQLDSHQKQQKRRVFVVFLPVLSVFNMGKLIRRDFNYTTGF
jgi:hypothetical protein